MKRYTLFIAMLLSIGLLGAISAFAVTKTSTGTGNWNAAIWSPAGTPGAGDDVIIASGHTVTVNENAECASLTFPTNNSSASNVNINSGITLSVSGTITIPRGSDPTINTVSVGSGTLNAGSIAFTNGGSGQRHRLTISTGTATITGNVTQSGSSGSATVTFTGAGLLNLGGTFLTSGTGTFTPSTGTVEYNGAAQTVGDFTYNNLTLSGSGTKTWGGTTTITGNFVNNGLTTTGAAVTISGTATQSIDGFTTGTVSMIKTGGTATFQGNVNGSGLTINGSGGTLNLGTGLTHTFTGTWTRTAGTLNAGSSTLRIGGSVSGTGGTFTASTGTVEWYAAGAQTVAGVTYNNLTLSGSGAKTTSSVTVNGILSLEGTATVSTAPTYGGSATLQYNTATARTAGVEWFNTFAATGGVIIDNTGTITLNADKQFGSNTNVPLNIKTGATLSTSGSNYGLTFHGNFINDGTLTAGSSNVNLAGTVATHSIAGFTTTGTVFMLKTGGTATFTGNVNGANLEINGSGGTLNLGTGLTHTFSSTWTRGNGTLNGGSSTLRIGGSVSGTGGTFTASTGTVEWYAAGAQTVAGVTYNNLTLSGSGSKTTSSVTVNGILSMEGTATAGNPIAYGSSATLRYNTSTNRTVSTNEWLATFAATGGVIIDNTATITLNAAKVFSSGTTLRINSGATLNPAGVTSTINGGATLEVNGTLDFSNASGEIRSGTSGTSTLTMGSTGVIKTIDPNGLGPASSASFSTQSGGAWNFSSVSTNGTIEYNRTTAQPITDRDYNHLTITNGGTKTWTLSATRTVNGNMTVNSGATLALSGTQTINLKGNWSSSGSFDAGASTFVMNGTSAQTMTGSTFNNLTIDNASGITFGSSHTVNGTLAFTTGKITLGAYNLTIGSGGSITGADASSYIVTDDPSNGKLVRNSVGTTFVDFPVGTTTSYNPVQIKTGSGADNFSASVVGSVSPASNDDNAAVQRTWILAEATPGGNGTIAFKVQWNGSEEGSTFVRASSDGWTYTTRWKRMVGSLVGVVTGSDPYVAEIATDALSSWAVANATGALPIQLASFTGVQIGNNAVRLDWSTISEINNYGFYVQRQADGQTEFTELPNSFIPGAGTTNVPQYYSWTDQNVPVGTWFYRLKQVDLDNSVHYTDPIQIDVLTGVKETAPIQFALLQNYPNPFNPSTEIKFSVEVTGQTRLDVYNTLGQRVATLFNDVAEAGQYYKLKLDGSQLSSGVYFYRLQNEKKSELRKMMLLK